MFHCLANGNKNAISTVFKTVISLFWLAKIGPKYRDLRPVKNGRSKSGSKTESGKSYLFPDGTAVAKNVHLWHTWEPTTDSEPARSGAFSCKNPKNDQKMVNFWIENRRFESRLVPFWGVDFRAKNGLFLALFHHFLALWTTTESDEKRVFS